MTYKMSRQTNVKRGIGMGWHRCRCHEIRHWHRFFAGVSWCRHRNPGVDTIWHHRKPARKSGIPHSLQFYPLILNLNYSKKINFCEISCKIAVFEEKWPNYASLVKKFTWIFSFSINFGGVTLGADSGFMTPVSWHRPRHRCRHWSRPRTSGVGVGVDTEKCRCYPSLNKSVGDKNAYSLKEIKSSFKRRPTEI